MTLKQGTEEPGPATAVAMHTLEGAQGAKDIRNLLLHLLPLLLVTITLIDGKTDRSQAHLCQPRKLPREVDVKKTPSLALRGNLLSVMDQASSRA